MKSQSGYMTETIELSETTVDEFIQSKLIVFNDDHNSFDWVIECFCNYLKHSPEQAEQCAFIIHTKGSCDVKRGSYEELLPYKTALSDAGLSVVIE